ncbi:MULTISPECIES: GNAT family N-acetyltransferase [Bradyrhizobium]|uniref:GNAT family N-acetyltransferase n=1 Tax=Bradyrhizobium brasilense TaxID=1419277 RepID=A0ABY8JI60_9BRAD|nr:MULTISPECIES: GNAT family N-acetyltransferase [Bradyrhizobium]MCP1912315.1 phosphinothricin acetyltransferase [Bradyrhizobium elkanii]MCP1829928.1 phosphinothricin acetyltransferase [Bradyrhizobium sp. USDA 4545]MCP1848574.1 phosphinothricin acetyltransferase [Bradyrhizobium sp. USDA 4541]MCP1923037.1 phosphinothricin acetyltransferase [Bradyrhizobium sp. USDA 4532]OMI10701.1 GNAT family N-acetyltransferase [Bradyrhizobium brasilense]
MIIRPATEQDIPAITAIFNEAVANSNAIWTEKQDSEAERLAWMTARLALGYPVLVAVEGTTVLGYGTFGDFRAFPGYRYSVEHSVYIHADHRGRGLGRIIVDELIAAATALGKHVMIAGIDGGNLASLRLHARAGFVEVARMPEVGRKFGRWLDLVFMQRLLDAPGAARAD